MKKYIDLIIIFIIFLGLMIGSLTNVIFLKIIFGVFLSFLLPGYFLLINLNLLKSGKEEFWFTIPGMSFALVSVLMLLTSYVYIGQWAAFSVTYSLFITLCNPYLTVTQIWLDL